MGREVEKNKNSDWNDEKNVGYAQAWLPKLIALLTLQIALVVSILFMLWNVLIKIHYSWRKHKEVSPKDVQEEYRHVIICRHIMWLADNKRCYGQARDKSW